MSNWTDNAHWERVALLAAIVILLTPAIYWLKDEKPAPLPEEVPVTFVGSDKCKRCHEAAYAKWSGSHHDQSMDIANETTVKGDFSDVRYFDPYNKITSRFYRKGGKFLVETEGPDGEIGEFEITHTFGTYPLQQYLVPFPGGRFQCLNIAWDVDQKTWYRLPPYEVEGPTDWLHWTKPAGTWNVMCSECHSTRLEKNYDTETGSYQTNWFEINVGCEACHGPGLQHLEWANKPPLARTATDNFGLKYMGDKNDNNTQINSCAPCHSRRYQLGDNSHSGGELLDLMVPSLLEEGLYHPDGQILEEVYVYGSFVQSKMYMHGVQCSDCHDVHSLKLHKDNNALCTQCHRSEVYDSYTHHFHKETYKGQPSDGYLCVKCHMPGLKYMGIDYRPDHSLRIPRPDLSETLDTPNSCSTAGCHSDKPLEWTIQKYTRWYGTQRKPHYGEAIKAGRTHNAEAEKELIRVADEPLLPPIVRATALQLLRGYPTETSQSTLAKALEDGDGLIRHTAILSLDYFDEDTRLKRIAPKLYDPVKAVRIEAAMMLSNIPIEKLRTDDQERFKQVLGEYRQAMDYNSDMASHTYNLGNLAANLQDFAGAATAYEKAIAIDSRFYPAKVNLAMLLNGQGRKEEAEVLLREVVESEPELYEVAYSLGLLLAEMNKYNDAEYYLGQAASGMNYDRAYYNHGQVLLYLNRHQEGEQALLKALQLDPQQQDFFAALVTHYSRTRQTEKMRSLAASVLQVIPDHKGAMQLMNILDPAR